MKKHSIAYLFKKNQVRLIWLTFRKKPTILPKSFHLRFKARLALQVHLKTQSRWWLFVHCFLDHRRCTFNSVHPSATRANAVSLSQQWILSVLKLIQLEGCVHGSRSVSSIWYELSRNLNMFEHVSTLLNPIEPYWTLLIIFEPPFQTLWNE